MSECATKLIGVVFYDCCLTLLGHFRYAAVYFAAGMENLLEELVMQCMPNDSETMLTSTILEHAIANNGDLWGLLQPYAHLNAGRVASGRDGYHILT